MALRYEERILDKYASWAQELQEKENFLRDYTRKLENQGIAVPDWESSGQQKDAE